MLQIEQRPRLLAGDSRVDGHDSQAVFALAPSASDVVAMGLPATVASPADERAARRALRRQIAKLERELASTIADAFPRLVADPPARVGGRGPRLLGLGELEQLRDDLARRLADARAEVAERADREHHNRVLLERMMLEPGRYKFARLPNADLGGGGCGVWQVRPRLGLIGMLAGWWQVKLSSGCPLPGGPRPGAVPCCFENRVGRSARRGQCRA